LEKEAFGSPATRARQPFFGEISSRFEFSKARSGLFLFLLLKFIFFDSIKMSISHKPSVQTMAKIAKALGVSIEDLIK